MACRGPVHISLFGTDPSLLDAFLRSVKKKLISERLCARPSAVHPHGLDRLAIMKWQLLVMELTTLNRSVIHQLASTPLAAWTADQPAQPLSETRSGNHSDGQ